MIIDDYQQVYDLWLNTKGMGLNDIDDSKAGIQRFLNRNPDTCFVAYINHQIIGVILAGNDGRRGYIYHTAVLKQYRHQKIGTQLVEMTLKAFEKQHISKVALVVFESNINGNKFWEKQGFTVRNDLIYRNQSLVEMQRIDT